jgi:hypothetical protein
MQAVHKTGLQIVADHGWAATYAYILAVCGRHGPLQRINGVRGEEVERVPPVISMEGRGVCVKTKTGQLNGGSSPHHPFQVGSLGKLCSPNLPAPMISAPMLMK